MGLIYMLLNDPPKPCVIFVHQIGNLKDSHALSQLENKRFKKKCKSASWRSPRSIYK